MGAHQHGTPMLISSGLVAQVEEARCQKCGRCAEICPFGATSAPQQSTGGMNPPVVDAQKCMGCGVCVRACPNEALALTPAADKPAPLEWPTAAS
jgi:ferredoxin